MFQHKYYPAIDGSWCW